MAAEEAALWPRPRRPALRVRHGRRPHSLGGSLHEIAVGDLLMVTLASHYDHVEDLQYDAPTLLLATTTHAVGVRKGRGYVRVYLGFGSLTVALAEEDEFDQLYPGGHDV